MNMLIKRKRETLISSLFPPVRVCAIVIPWNYPLMMLAWKTAACLAAGNTIVLKPAQVSQALSIRDHMNMASAQWRTLAV